MIPIFNDIYYVSAFLGLVALISIYLGIYIIISKNPIISVLFLIGLFCCIAIYLISIGLEFIGLSYLLVYVGAVSILFLFILMLINIRVSELSTDKRNNMFLAALLLLTFNYFFADTLPDNRFSSHEIFFLDRHNNIINSIHEIFNSISFSLTLNTGFEKEIVPLLSDMDNVSSNIWDSDILVTSHVSAIGDILYTNLFILFMISSFILLLSMIGAIDVTLNVSNNSKSYKFINRHLLSGASPDIIVIINYLNQTIAVTCRSEDLNYVINLLPDIQKMSNILTSSMLSLSNIPIPNMSNYMPSISDYMPSIAGVIKVTAAIPSYLYPLIEYVGGKSADYIWAMSLDSIKSLLTGSQNAIGSCYEYVPSFNNFSEYLPSMNNISWTEDNTIPEQVENNPKLQDSIETVGTVNFDSLLHLEKLAKNGYDASISCKDKHPSHEYYNSIRPEAIQLFPLHSLEYNTVTNPIMRNSPVIMYDTDSFGSAARAARQILDQIQPTVIRLLDLYYQSNNPGLHDTFYQSMHRLNYIARSVPDVNPSEVRAFQLESLRDMFRIRNEITSHMNVIRSVLESATDLNND